MNSNDLLLNDVIRCRQCDQMGQIIFLHLCPFKYSKICNFLSWQGQTFSQYKITPPQKKIAPQHRMDIFRINLLPKL